MKLVYHESANFGDALNPLIFEALAPGFCDERRDTVLVGIGSMLGLLKSWPETRSRIVFSTGYAAGSPRTYGTPPTIDSSYDVMCVRGRLTARALGLDPSLAVADGALLVRALDIERPRKAYRFSYMPHVGSEDFCSEWPAIVADCGMHYISPRSPAEFVLKEIVRSDVVVAEAMHGAIVADALGIPWIAVKAYETINAFKWQDYCSSLNLEYRPNRLPSYFGKEYVEKQFQVRFPGLLPSTLRKVAAYGYRHRPSSSSRDQVVTALGRLTGLDPLLSSRSLVASRTEQLHERLEAMLAKYGGYS